MIITLPDGYNGDTVQCNAEPLEIDGPVIKLAVIGGGVRWVRLKEYRERYENALWARAFEASIEAGDWEHYGTAHFSRTFADIWSTGIARLREIEQEAEA